MATLQERTDGDGRKRYRVQIRLRGYPPQSATFDRKTDARIWAQQTETEMRAGRYMPRVAARKHTVAEMIDRYRAEVLQHKAVTTQSPQRTQLAWWRDKIGHVILSDVTPSVVADARDRLLREPMSSGATKSSSTAVRYLAVLSHCFTVAQKDWGWVDGNPVINVSKPKEPPGRTRFLSDEERDRLLAACMESRNPFLYPIVVLALSTGMRKSEILGLTWDRIDLRRGIITLSAERTKNRTARGVPLVGHALEMMKRASEQHTKPTGLVFPARARSGRAAKPIDIQAAWKGATRRAKLEDFRFHDLRHTAASYLLMNGATLGELAEVLGHKSFDMVRRYAHLTETHTSKVVERMNRAMFGTSTDGRTG